MYRFIFEARPYPGKEEYYINAWRQGSSIIQQQPGALGTRLFQKLGDSNVLVAMADWESKDMRDSAMAEVNNLPDEVLKITKAHQEFADIKPLGGFELTEEVHNR